MPTDSRSPGVRLELLWALATALVVVAVLTWRCALDPQGEDQPTPAAGPAVPSATDAGTAEAFASCGEETRAPDTSLNLDARDCLLAAAAVGTRVEFNTTVVTTEGQPVYWRVRVLAWGDIEVTIDNRADEFSGAARRRVVTFHCTSLAPSSTGERRIEVSGCESGEVLTF